MDRSFSGGERYVGHVGEILGDLWKGCGEEEEGGEC